MLGQSSESQKTRELEIRNEALDNQTNMLLKELKVTPEQLTKFIESSEHFTEENWEMLQHQKTKLEQKLKTDLENISNPLKTKKRQEERNIGTHWMFVR